MDKAILASINRLARVISSDADLDKIFHSFADELKELVGFDRLSICLIEEDELKLFVVSSKVRTRLDEKQTCALQDAGASWVKLHGKTSIEADLAIEKQFPIDDIELDSGLRSVIRVPLFSNGEVFGTINLLKAKPYAYGKREKSILELLATQIAGPIAVSKAYKVLRGSLSLTQAMLELIQIASTGLETEEFATSFASCLKELMPFDKATINLLNPNDRSYQVIPVFPPITSKEGNNNTLSLELSAVEWVISRNRTNIEDDIIEGGEFASDSSLAKQGYRAAIRVPLSFNGQPFGCFSLLSYQQEVYGRKEQQRIEQLCAVLSHVIWYQHIAAVEKEALLEVEARDKARAQFVQVLGHELRTPLTPILACARMLKERLPTEAEGLENKLISNIMTGAQTLETRLSDLLDLAQYQTCAYTLELHKVDPRALIEKVISHFEPLVESKGQSLAVDLPDNLPPISADGRRLSQVLMNLLSNSVKFTPEGSNIQVRARLVKHEIVVEVQDDGPGLSEEQKQRLFEPYWRSEMDRHRFQGMGLGLALCKQLVEAHGGRIWAESEPGKGSTFAFAVPLERYAAKGGVHT